MTTSYGSENSYCQGDDDFDESAEAERWLAELKRKMIRDGDWTVGDVEDGGSAEWAGAYGVWTDDRWTVLSSRAGTA
ncbi:hypothetical protein VNO78_19841 [Psophocarpus tetragonolobus]|uniref:Uncharacterized protein n=1 Tax=Psophocarpus tetragonolobus TaxID=3891 RepID=A0AAN9S9B5_PSOTE